MNRRSRIARRAPFLAPFLGGLASVALAGCALDAAPAPADGFAEEATSEVASALQAPAPAPECIPPGPIDMLWSVTGAGTENGNTVPAEGTASLFINGNQLSFDVTLFCSAGVVGGPAFLITQGSLALTIGPPNADCTYQLLDNGQVVGSYDWVSQTITTPNWTLTFGNGQPAVLTYTEFQIDPAGGPPTFYAANATLTVLPPIDVGDIIDDLPKIDPTLPDPTVDPLPPLPPPLLEPPPPPPPLPLPPGLDPTRPYGATTADAEGDATTLRITDAP